MDRRNQNSSVRRTGWAALDRDRSRTRWEFICPHCARGTENARRNVRGIVPRMFLQDLQGEVTQCHACKRTCALFPL